MRKRKLPLVGLVIALMMVSAGFSCSHGTQNLAVASDTIAHALADAQKAAQQAQASGIMSAQEYQTFNGYLVSVSTAGVSLDSAIRQNETATQISQQVTNFLAAFNQLQQTGLVGIKDKNTQLAISTIITGAEAAVAVIAAQVGGK